MILDQSKVFWNCPNHFGLVHISFDRSKNVLKVLNFTFWHLLKTFWTLPKLIGLAQNNFEWSKIRHIEGYLRQFDFNTNLWVFIFWMNHHSWKPPFKSFCHIHRIICTQYNRIIIHIKGFPGFFVKKTWGCSYDHFGTDYSCPTSNTCYSTFVFQ